MWCSQSQRVREQRGDQLVNLTQDTDSCWCEVTSDASVGNTIIVNFTNLCTLARDCAALQTERPHRPQSAEWHHMSTVEKCFIYLFNEWICLICSCMRLCLDGIIVCLSSAIVRLWIVYSYFKNDGQSHPQSIIWMKMENECEISKHKYKLHWQIKWQTLSECVFKRQTVVLLMSMLMCVTARTLRPLCGNIVSLAFTCMFPCSGRRHCQSALDSPRCSSAAHTPSEPGQRSRSDALFPPPEIRQHSCSLGNSLWAETIIVKSRSRSRAFIFNEGSQ